MERIGITVKEDIFSFILTVCSAYLAFEHFFYFCLRNISFLNFFFEFFINAFIYPCYIFLHILLGVHVMFRIRIFFFF